LSHESFNHEEREGPFTRQEHEEDFVQIGLRVLAVDRFYLFALFAV
jgi:hypothetical protein